METLRLVVTGAVGAGKSTFIRSVSEIEVVDTDACATDETALLKKTTTVAFDFGRLQFAPDMALHLYGTPGQARFNFMWDILIRDAHAYILLVAAHRPGDFRHARNIVKYMNQQVRIPMIVGLTHSDFPEAWSEDDVSIALGFGDKNHRPPIVKVDATQRGSVSEAVIVLVQHLLESCLV